MNAIETLLREQIFELTKLLELKDARIKELEALRNIPGHIIIPELSSVHKPTFTKTEILKGE